ncbi:hypothetical protein [Streptomyces sp. WM6373]|uniref:hypothetical protein n=1 Tax=Streptomyces sp. WM6373 TaxID=1415556 RepID=UPI000AB1DC03|nr:hypothetical protein [Streptomyces sp. WM6373]
MPEQPAPTPTEQQRLLAAWNASRFARAALQRSGQRSAERLLRRPPNPPAS